MKKFKFWINILTIISLLFLIYGIVFAKGLTIDETKKQLEGDPYKIATWMAQNMKTVKDSINYSQPAEYTYKHKKGDCEDFALLSQYFIGDKYETYIVVWAGEFREDSKYYAKMKGRKIYHAVVAIKMNENNWGIIDQDRFIQHGRTLAEIVKINCDLRRIKVKEAFIMNLIKFGSKVIKEIDLNE